MKTKTAKLLIGFLSGIILGILCHVFAKDAPWLDTVIKSVAYPIGQIFLRMIFMIVVPLVFTSLALGVYEMGDLRKIGRVGIYTLIYTIVASVASVAIGLGLVLWLKPGIGLDMSVIQKMGLANVDTNKVLEFAKGTKGIGEIIVSLIPKNPLGSAVNALDGEMIALMIFALIFGVALALVRPNSHDDPLVKFMETLRDVSMKIIDFAMALAPYGVAALMFAMTAKFGWGLMLTIGKYVSVVLIGLCLQQFVVLGVVLKLGSRFSPLEFFSKIREVMITAFSTSSSNATLPTSLRVADQGLKLDRRVSSFVLTVGSTANQNGTALFEGVTILFLAQLFSVNLTFSQQVVVLFMSVVAGIGTAGVPGGSIPLIVIILQSVGVPAEGIGVILGVDRFLDMCRTVLNVSGDLVGAAVIDQAMARSNRSGMEQVRCES